jgi:hypothetical protein
MPATVAEVLPFAASLAARLAVDEDRVTPGLLGFAVVAVLGVATWLLIRSMQSRLRKVEVTDDDADAGRPPGQRSPDGTDPPGPAGGDAEDRG